MSVAAPSLPLARVRQPGLWTPGSGVERYRVAGRGCVVVGVAPGDRVSVLDCEGGQPGELALFAADGRALPAALGAGDGVPADGLRSVLATGREDADRVVAALRRRGIDPATARGVPLFSPDSAPGSRADFSVEVEGVLVLSVPGAAVGPLAGEAPVTELELHVSRAPRGDDELWPWLPEPLADPRLDFRVQRATAGAYEVRAGEYIQIIDVEGRECSDFQALAAARLQAGVEREIDPTTTRTLLGAAYPGPGLYSKFFDADMQPLVEVVRDTVGRHDTFGLACTARYYEDQGILGHPNCSDNYNHALAPYGVKPRVGWPAINFFYNTRVDDHNALYLDEPWSRPGDYVLLRALSDLVCASSACPDDTTAANGWRPTDIHVRVYPEKNVFSKAVAYRMSPESPAQLTRETGFHPRTSLHTRRFTEYRGYWLATSFNDEGALAEYWACREKAAIMDLSPLRKFEVSGPDAESLMQYTMTRNIRRLAVGQVVYTAMCYPHGGMIDDGTLFRLGPDTFRWIGGEAWGGEWLREKARERGFQVQVRSSTDQMHNVAVQGPASREILRQVVWTPPAQPTVEELGWFRFTVGRLGDYNGVPLVVSRTGYTGELGYEVFCHPDAAPAVWDAIEEAGKPHGLAPLGLEALDMLRIEAGLVFAGYEFSDETDPFEAGIGFSVALKTTDEDFVGREALERRRAHPQRALVGLELGGDEVAAHGDCVHIGRAQVGVVTSGTRSPYLAKSIALARLDVSATEVGTEVEVGKLDGHQKRLPARVVPFPFYDPEKLRVRA
jgi:aminomethyltransferase